MKKLFILLFIIITPLLIKAQMLGYFPPNVSIFDNLSADNTGFMYSFRKIKSSYNGFCFRARRADNNAQVDVSFDANGKISGNSNCKVVSIGTSAYTVNQQITWTNFNAGTTNIRVLIWYDQSGNSRDATQPLATYQPKIEGYQNDLFYLIYTGIENLYCPFASNVLLSANGAVLGVDGTLFAVLTASKVPSGTEVYSFGYRAPQNGTNIRWFAHLNYFNGLLYFDAGETSSLIRSFDNNVNGLLWKQYTFQRLMTNKLVRISGTQKLNGIGGADRYDAESHSFGIGNTNRDVSFGHVGNIGEFILLKNLSLQQMLKIEEDQMKAWNVY